MTRTISKLPALGKVARAFLVFALIVGLSIPNAMLSSASKAFAEETTFTVTIQVEGYSDALPSLAVQSNKLITGSDDKAIDPLFFNKTKNTYDNNPTFTSGKLDTTTYPLVALQQTKDAQGKQLKWTRGNASGATWNWATDKVLSNMTLYGSWVDKQVDVIIDACNGTTPVTKTIPYDTALPASERPATPTRAGFDFVEWYVPGVAGAWDFNTKLTESVIVSAKWKLVDASIAELDNPPTDTSPDATSGTATVLWEDRDFAHPIPLTNYGDGDLEHGSAIYTTSTFGVNLSGGVLDNTSVNLYCLSPGVAAEPRGYSHSYQAYLKNINYDTGETTYWVYMYSPTYQNLGAEVTIYREYGGWIDVHKSSANTSMTDNNSAYTLAGAVFNIYETATNLLRDQIVTDANGYAHSKVLPRGDYYVVEEHAPTGYALPDDKDNRRDVSLTVDNNGQTLDVYWSDLPQNDPIQVFLGKKDADRTWMGHNLPEGSASLKDAVYSVEFYGGVSWTSVNDVETNAPKKATWYYKTDEDGYMNAGNPAYIASGYTSSPFYYASDGTVTLPLGTYIIKEVTAPKGYNRSESVEMRVLKSFGQSETVFNWVAPDETTALNESVKRGHIKLEKRDKESKLLTPLGAADLDTTVFQVVNKSTYSVVIDGIIYEPDEVCWTGSPTDGKLETADIFPYGTYEISEAVAGDGYELNEEVRTFVITEQGQEVNYTQNGPGGDTAWYNQVERADFRFSKVRHSDQHPLSRVPFLITSQTTGEWHIAVTDLNGYLSTRSDYAKNSENTNANDKYYDPERGVITDFDALTNQAGLWWGKTREGWTVEPDDSLFSMPYDTYTVEELRCPNNEGLELITRDLFVTSVVCKDCCESNKAYDIGTIYDDPMREMAIATVASDPSDGDKIISAEPETLVRDTITYVNAEPGTTYRTVMTAMDPVTNEPIENAVGEGSFTVVRPNGTAKVDVTLDLSKMPRDGKFVIYEEVYILGEDEPVCTHQDIEDEDQSLVAIVPRIGSEALDAADGNSELAHGSQVSVADHVTFSNLQPNTDYSMHGTLVKVRKNGTVEPMTDNEGNPVTQIVDFTTGDDTSGSVDVFFDLDSTTVHYDTTLVVFEGLYRNGKLITEHADPGDVAQSVKVKGPDVTTNVRDTNTGLKVSTHGSQVHLTDEVTWTGIQPGQTYTHWGIILDPTTGHPIMRSNAEIAKIFNVSEDDAAYAASLLSLFIEKAWAAESFVWEGDREAFYEQEIGLWHELLGRLGLPEDIGHNQAETGEILDVALPIEIDRDGWYQFLDDRAPELACFVTATATLTPDSDPYVFEVHYDFDSADLKPGKYVICDVLGTEGKVVQIRPNLTDSNQEFVLVVPEIGTDASDYTLISDAATLTDTVAYHNLDVTREYTLSGVLMDKAAGNEFLVNNMPVSASTTFTPESPDGTIDVMFSFDATGVESGTQVVVFETLYADGDVITEHTDLNAVSQMSTLLDPEIHTVATNEDGVSDEDRKSLSSNDPTTPATKPDTGNPVITPIEDESGSGDGGGNTPSITPGPGATVPGTVAGTGPKELNVQVIWEDEGNKDGMRPDALVYQAYPLELVDKTPNHLEIELSADNIWVGTFMVDESDIQAADKDNAFVSLAVDSLSDEAKFRIYRYYDWAIGTTGNMVTFTYTRNATPASNTYTMAAVREAINDGAITEEEAMRKLQETGDPLDIDAVATEANAVDLRANHSIPMTEHSKVIDTVMYSNFIAGKPCVIEGTLMNKESGKPATVGGVPVTATLEFTPESSSGEAQVVFEFDGTAFDVGEEFVVFERAYVDGKLFASHEDIDDEAQTVVMGLGTVHVNAKTGVENDSWPIVWVILAVAIGGFMVYRQYNVWQRHKRTKA